MTRKASPPEGSPTPTQDDESSRWQRLKAGTKDAVKGVFLPPVNLGEYNQSAQYVCGLITQIGAELEKPGNKKKVKANSLTAIDQKLLNKPQQFGDVKEARKRFLPVKRQEKV
ncbi:MAG: hypothetical protein V1936_01700, partial [Patescibacteria group bacterium]